MHDAFLNRSLRFTIAALISAITLICLIFSSRGLLELLGAEWLPGAQKLAWGMGAAIAALLLIHYREDLLDDQ